MPHGVWPLVAVIHDPNICFEGNRFLLTVSNLGGAESTSVLSPSPPRDPELLLLPKILQTETTPRSSPFPYPSFLILSWPYEQSISILCTVHSWVSDAIFLQQLSLFQILAHCSQAPCHSPGRTCHAALDHSVPEAGA